MKLATFSTADNPTPRLGRVDADGIVDLAAIASQPDSMAAYLEAGADVASVTSASGPVLPLNEVTLHAPVPNPGKILAIGLNYRDHVEESGMKEPEVQMWFNKQHNCINGPYDGINLPAVSGALDYEAELCLVVGKRCKHVPAERAHEVIAGYFCGNDVSVRDWQMAAQTMQIGKSFDTHGPIGPYLVTPDEVEDPHNLDIRATVNGEERQRSNTKHLIFDCFDAIAHLTKAFTLDTGDILFMGTPAGVGAAMNPRQFLKEGDVVRVEIDKLGYIENKVAAADAQTVIG